MEPTSAMRVSTIAFDLIEMRRARAIPSWEAEIGPNETAVVPGCENGIKIQRNSTKMLTIASRLKTLAGLSFESKTSVMPQAIERSATSIELSRADGSVIAKALRSRIRGSVRCMKESPEAKGSAIEATVTPFSCKKAKYQAGINGVVQILESCN